MILSLARLASEVGSYGDYLNLYGSASNSIELLSKGRVSILEVLEAS